jgi:hypothetical protein
MTVVLFGSGFAHLESGLHAAFSLETTLRWISEEAYFPENLAELVKDVLQMSSFGSQEPATATFGGCGEG